MFPLQVLYIQSLTPSFDFSEGSLENSKWNDVLVSFVFNIVHKGFSGKKTVLVLKACPAKIRFLNFSILD